MKRIWAVVAILCLVLSVTNCGGGGSLPESPAQAPSSSTSPQALPPDVIISYNISFNGTAMVITGQASVPDGALLTYEVTSKPFVIDASADGVAEVKDGRWSATVDLSNFPHGRIEIWVAFQTALGTTGEQPANIIDLYGEDGERITGPQTTVSGHFRRAELVKTVEY